MAQGNEANEKFRSSGDPVVDDLAKERPWEKSKPDWMKPMTSDRVKDLPKKSPTYADLERTEEFKTPDLNAASGTFNDIDVKTVEEAVTWPAESPSAPAPAPPAPRISKAIDLDDEFADYEAQVIETTGDRAVEVGFTTGAAGCGKTHFWREKIKDDPKAGVLCATTGIAGVNLGSITLNSLLGYFDSDSLNELYLQGRLTKKLAELSKQYLNIVIDEVSMMPAEQLDTLVRAADEVAGYKTVSHPIGIQLTGDFCQLPPVKGKWAFDAQCWPRFEANVTRLTKCWRQNDAKFLEAINLVRSGNGRAGAEALKATAVTWANGRDMEFRGTTIVAKNAEVDRHNFLALQKVQGQALQVTSSRWGKQRGEWKNIPDTLDVKIGAYVMILANDSPNFTYANGDCGVIEDYDATRRTFKIKLVRNGLSVYVPEIVRTFEVKTTDNTWANPATWNPREWYKEKREFKVEGRKAYGVGQVKYPPIRLAYAATVHKTQGLSLDLVQMDVRDAFFGWPSMCYVALSRARTPEGLRIVGGLDVFANRTKIAPEVLRWL